MKRQKLFIAAYYSPENAGSRMTALVQPMLESNRVKCCKQHDISMKSTEKPNRIQLGTGEALYIKVECAQLIYIVLTMRSYDPKMAESMLNKTRELLMNKAREKGIVDMDQYFGSGALNMEAMIRSEALKEIVDEHNALFTSKNGLPL